MRAEALAGAGASPADVEDCYRRAIERATRQGARSWQLKASLGLARHRGGQGAEHEAARLLEPILQWFTEGAETPDLMQARRLLLEPGVGDRRL